MHTIVFAGGGTAGHVMPNLAVMEALGGAYNCVYVGGDGMEKDICAARGIPFYGIQTVKLRRDAVIKNLAIPFKLGKCVRSAERVLREIEPDLIFSKGGFAALPVVLAAKNIPILCHESDFSPGIVTKLSKRRSEYVLCSFEPCAKLFKNGLFCGAPLRQSLYRGTKRDFGFADRNRPTLLVMGGSSGAAAINDCVVSALPLLSETFNVVHLTGKNKNGAARQSFYLPVEFENDMAGLYASVDIAITRGGANALAELAALKIPSIVIPLEKASRGDQVQNAEYFAEKGAVKVLREQDMTAASIADGARALLAEKSKYSDALARMRTDGTAKICAVIKSTLAKHSDLHAR